MSVIRKDKPWAHLRVSRKQYEAARPWKKAGLTREAFEALLLSIPVAALDELLREADAEKLLAALNLLA